MNAIGERLLHASNTWGGRRWRKLRLEISWRSCWFSVTRFANPRGCFSEKTM
jgi:hypothetical protein